MGITLPVRWLWLQCAEEARPWSDLPVSSDPQIKAFFKASTIFELGDSRAFRSWTDPRINGRSIWDMSPDLFAAVAPRPRRQKPVANALHNDCWIQDNMGPLMVPVLIQYLQLRERLQGVVLSVERPDKILWR
jgi:hypothetical protein